MSSAISTRGLRLDNRGVTPIIGFILLFGIGVIAFASYQATTVPDQNAETEFEHSQSVRDDMVSLQTAVQQAGHNTIDGGGPQYATVQLGTNYRQRLFAINPPPVSGTLGVTEQYTVELEGPGQQSQEESTRFIEYRPQYNEIPSDQLRIENSLLYLDPESATTDNIVRYAGPDLIDDGTFRVFGIQSTTDSAVQGTQRESVRTSPNENEGVFDAVTIPTRITPEQWDEQLENLTLGEDFEEIPNGPNSDSSLVTDIRFDVDDSDEIEEIEFASTRVNIGELSEERQPRDGDPVDEIRVRVDDITFVSTDEPRLYVSYDVSGEVDTVDITAENTETGQTVTEEGLTANRGGVLLEADNGAGEEFEITVSADNEQISDRTITTIADTSNPSDENDELAQPESPELNEEEFEIEDRTDNQNQYRFSWEIVDNQNEFGEIRLLALTVESPGSSNMRISEDESVNNFDVELDDPSGEYKVGALVKDQNAVVVDEITVIDQADGEDPSV